MIDVGDYSMDCSSDPMCSFATGDMMKGFQKRVFNTPKKIHLRPEFGQNRFQRFDSRGKRESWIPRSSKVYSPSDMFTLYEY